MHKPNIVLYRQCVDSFKKEHVLMTTNDFDVMVYPVQEILQNQEVVDVVSAKSKIFYKLTNFLSIESNDQCLRQMAEKHLLREIELVEKISKQKSYFLYCLESGKCANVSRILTRPSKNVLLLETKMMDLYHCPWQLWNNWRSQADFSESIKLVLELTNEIPEEEVILRWLGEPIQCIIIPVELFFYKEWYPELDEAHIKLLKRFIEVGVCDLMLKVRDTTEIDLFSYQDSLLYYVNEYQRVPQFNFDQLGIPLQPLYESLNNRTYEIFELDPKKYYLYQMAIENALKDIISDEDSMKKKAVIMILGAGRGPLVRAALNAAINTKRKIKVYIVEKNPNAIITLNALKNEIWTKNDITIFAKDMRFFEPPEKSDILVSELLGSFGCNELSPECLDGVQKHLKPNGISIPSKYTSYVNPVMSSKLYQKNRARDRIPNPIDKFKQTHSNFECSYVVCPKSIYHIDEPKPLFTFVHPNHDPVIDNTRYKALQFKAKLDTVLHGFIGYFDAVLYKDVFISIHPYTHTMGMFSWHNFYLPLTEPQQIKGGEIIEANFWRCSSPFKVWYEWSVSKPNKTHIHNLRGDSCPIYK
uniref:Protein arginine N-methyltransferase n=1 Tax=Culicoides sonorensis TaxID=179676 RepID=A0A336K664_CULSO